MYLCLAFFFLFQEDLTVFRISFIAVIIEWKTRPLRVRLESGHVFLSLHLLCYTKKGDNWSLDITLPTGESHPLSCFLDNKQDRRRGRMYRQIAKNSEFYFDHSRPRILFHCKEHPQLRLGAVLCK